MGAQEHHETRQERREDKLRSRRERMRKHGRGFARAYRDAVVKRATGRRRKGRG